MINKIGGKSVSEVNITSETIINLMNESHMTQIAAFAAAGVSLISCIVNAIVNCVNNKNNIDKEVKAQSRREWINSVKEISAKLFSEYLSLLSLKLDQREKKYVDDKLLVLNELTQKLILDFGIDLCDTSISLNNTITNEGKNKAMTDEIKSLFSDFYKYYGVVEDIDSQLKIENNKLQRAVEAIDDCYVIVGMGVWDDDGVEVTGPAPKDVNDLYEKLDTKISIEDKIKSLNEIKKGLNKKVLILRKHIMIYLKLEWERVKILK